jgi:prepilin peptidase CpaA
MDLLLLPLLLVFPVLMAIGAVTDVASLTIPNWISLALLAAFLALAPFADLTLTQFGLHVAIGLTALVAGIGLFALGVVGGGDAKLAAAALLWVGPAAAQFLLAMAVYGGVLALVLVLFRRLPLPAAGARQGWLQRLHERGAGVPYGLAIAAAAITVYPRTPWFAAFSG